MLFFEFKNEKRNEMNFFSKGQYNNEMFVNKKKLNVDIPTAHILKQLTQAAGLASLNSGTGTALYGRGQL